MSAMSFAKQAYTAFNREKPHSSITEWVEILTAPGYDEEAYDGIPELVDSISIQATGPAEASRALRKKLKHGDSHQQYRALVILRALVENGGHKFQTSFADNQLTDALRTLASEPTTDPKVKKKLVSVLGAWHTQFKDDPTMSSVANLYNTVKPHQSAIARATRQPEEDPYQIEAAGLGLGEGHEERKRREEREKRERKEEEKRKAKEAKEAEKARLKKLEEEKRSSRGKGKRQPFNFEQEKSQIMTAIANATQAANNLVNAITLVNTEHDSLQNNERVQECLEKAKVARKQIVRYVQLVENEDMIGTLIETNDRIIAALETYDTLSKPTVTEKDVTDVQNNLAAVKIQDTELGKLQEKQRAAVQRSLGRASGQLVNGKERATSDDDDDDYPSSRHRSSYVHPDLQDLNFGALGFEQRSLPPPMRPSAPHTRSDEDSAWRRGSLSDFSDYESSDEEVHNRASTSVSGSRARNYGDVSDDESVDARGEPKQALLDDADPFADPQDDEVDDDGVATPGIPQHKPLHW